MVDYGGYSEIFGKYHGVAFKHLKHVFTSRNSFRSFWVLVYCAVNGDPSKNGLAILDSDQKTVVGDDILSQTSGVSGPNAEQLTAAGILSAVEDSIRWRDVLNTVALSDGFYYDMNGLPAATYPEYFVWLRSYALSQQEWVDTLAGAEKIFWTKIYTYLYTKANNNI